MSRLSSVIVNEIFGADLYTVRFDIEPSKRAILYAIDTENCDEEDILIIDEKGLVTPQVTKIANKTILKFDKRSDIYSLSYVKKEFVRNSNGFFEYKEQWSALPLTFFVLALPEYAVIETLEDEELEKHRYNNRLILSKTEADNFKHEICYRIASKDFDRLYKNLKLLETHEADMSNFAWSGHKSSLSLLIGKVEGSLDWIGRLAVLQQILDWIKF